MSRSYSGRRAINRAKFASTIKGASSFRRLLRRVPDATRSRLVDFLTVSGAKLADIMGGRVNLSTRSKHPWIRGGGHLRLAIGYKVLPATLALKLGLLTNKLKRDYFYGHILDVGRKAGSRPIRYGARGRANRLSSYAKPAMAHWGAIAPMRLEAKSLQDFRDMALPDYRNLLLKVLLEVGAGAGDD